MISCSIRITFNCGCDSAYFFPYSYLAAAARRSHVTIRGTPSETERWVNLQGADQGGLKRGRGSTGTAGRAWLRPGRGGAADRKSGLGRPQGRTAKSGFGVRSPLGRGRRGAAGRGRAHSSAGRGGTARSCRRADAKLAPKSEETFQN